MADAPDASPCGRERRARETRQQIVEAAASEFRAKGIAGTSVADVMNAAGRTHGGFYAYFRSKDALARAAIGWGLGAKRRHWLRGLEDADDETWLRRVVGRYLRADHRDNPADGCMVAALGPEIARLPDEEREFFDEHMRKTATSIAQRLPGQRRDDGKCAEGAGDRALAIFALLVGGMVLARAVKSRRLSDRILRACREMAVEGRHLDRRDGA